MVKKRETLVAEPRNQKDVSRRDFVKVGAAAGLGAAVLSAPGKAQAQTALADIKWASWAIVNRKLSSWDFDYQKYGIWKYMRARQIMVDPRWESWLRTI